MNLEIKEAKNDDLEKWLYHRERHQSENGPDLENIFEPFEKLTKEEEEEFEKEKKEQWKHLETPLSKCSWKRAWFLWDVEKKQIVGEVSIRGGSMPASLHRCFLGIGIEKEYRNLGYGKKLMMEALEFAKNAKEISWVDLGVFAHNLRAMKLYESLGFEKIGVQKDLFRVHGHKIDDLMMTKDVSF